MICYARVSTEAQDLTSQLAQLKAAGCEKVFREKITGTTARSFGISWPPSRMAMVSLPLPLTASRAMRPIYW
jgi:hypothetical protein